MSNFSTTSDREHFAQESESPSFESKSKSKTTESREAVATKPEGAKPDQERPPKKVEAIVDGAKDQEQTEDDDVVDKQPWRDATPEEMVWSTAAAAADFLPEGVKDEGEYPLPSRSWGWKRAPEAVSEEVARARHAAAKTDFLPAGVVDEGEYPIPSRRQGWKRKDAVNRAKAWGSGEAGRDAEVGDQQS